MRPRRRTRWTLATALAVLALLGTGCGAARGSAGLDAAASPPIIVDASRLTLPLDRYLLSPADTVLVARAYRVLLNECARRFGLTPPPEPPAAPEPRTWDERRYGITDLALAATAGYRLSPQPPPVNTRPTAPDDPRALEVLTGRGRRVIAGRTVPPDGCTGETKRHLNDGVLDDVDPYLAQRLGQQSYLRSEADPRVRAVLRSWSDCMRGRGHHYPTPLAAAADPRFRRGPVSSSEIATARDDIACKRQTNLVGVWSAAEADLQRADIAAHRPALERLRRSNDAQLRVVHDLHLTAHRGSHP